MTNAIIIDESIVKFERDESSLAYLAQLETALRSETEYAKDSGSIGPWSFASVFTGQGEAYSYLTYKGEPIDRIPAKVNARGYVANVIRKLRFEMYEDMYGGQPHPESIEPVETDLSPVSIEPTPLDLVSADLRDVQDELASVKKELGKLRVKYGGQTAANELLAKRNNQLKAIVKKLLREKKSAFALDAKARSEADEIRRREARAG